MYPEMNFPVSLFLRRLLLRGVGALVFSLITMPWTPNQVSAEIQYVINVSIDGLGSSYLKTLVDSNQLPNLQRFVTQGAWTYNARSDYDYTVTLPNHTTMVTGRGINGAAGHNWTGNGTPSATDTIHKNKGSYVASGFDVVHDNGLRTGMYASKSKFSLFDQSYNASNGGIDNGLPDFGRDKLDTYYYNSDTATMTSSFVAAMQADPFNYSFLHYTDPDTTGHASGWGSTNYNNSVMAVDALIGDIFSLVENTDGLTGNTVILVTADHGGTGTSHSNAGDPLNYAIPFGAWGTDVNAGGDLYELNDGVKLDPGTGRPLYSDAIQPIRNGDIANLSLSLLGLDAIPGSTLNANQNFSVPEPSTFVLFGAGMIVLLVSVRRRK